MSLGDFSSQAAAYQRARPTYPQAILDALIDEAGLRPGDPVADFGAGTGIMTALLVQRGFSVSAIEPNAAMRDRSAELDGVRWFTSTFEESGLESASQRWAIAAQAFHWADPQRALPELRRILQPESLFTIVWNNRANRDSEVLGWTEAAIRRLVPEFDEAYRNRDWADVLESTGDFEFTKQLTVRHVITMSRERYLDLWNSHNRLNHIAGKIRFDRFLSELKTYLIENDCYQIDVPYDCEAWSARSR